MVATEAEIAELRREAEQVVAETIGPIPTLADAAIEYAKAGWPVFPLRGKSPLKGSHGFYDATVDVAEVLHHWRKYPNHNIGTSIPESMMLVDVDAHKDGLATLHDFEETLGVPDTLSALTPGGGLHLYFLHPGGELRQGTDILGPGIDTRIPGKGFSVLPPSKHKSGRRYEWYEQDFPPAQMPRWIIDRLRPEPPKKMARVNVPVDGDTDARLTGLIKAVSAKAALPKGHGWNDTLYWAGCRAGDMVLEGADPHHLESALLDAAGPWNERETRVAIGTIRSGMNRTGASR